MVVDIKGDRGILQSTGVEDEGGLGDGLLEETREAPGPRQGVCKARQKGA